jgi:hypothetical protein
LIFSSDSEVLEGSASAFFLPFSAACCFSFFSGTCLTFFNALFSASSAARRAFNSSTLSSLVSESFPLAFLVLAFFLGGRSVSFSAVAAAASEGGASPRKIEGSV